MNWRLIFLPLVIFVPAFIMWRLGQNARPCRKGCHGCGRCHHGGTPSR